MELAALSHFYGMSLAELRAMKLDEYRAFRDYMREYYREQRRAARRP